MPKSEIIATRETYEWLDKVESKDRIPHQAQWMMVLLLKDFHRRLKDIEEAAYESKSSTED